MSVMTSVIPHGRPFTVDGMLHVSPAPWLGHQVVPAVAPTSAGRP